MTGGSRSRYESLTVGFMFVAVAVSLMIAWAIGDWWSFIPLMLIAAGLFLTSLGFAMRAGGRLTGPGRGETSYFAFWGITLAILGAIWIVNDQFPDNVPMLVALFLVWIGAAVLVLSLKRFNRNRNA